MTTFAATEINIVDLIEKNPITKLSTTYNGKLLTKIKNSFKETQQQLFVASFYCYLHYSQKDDFIIDLNNVWEWLGFSNKCSAKRVLERHFILDKDYKVLLNQSVEQKKGSGGHNKEIIMMTVKCFKRMCLKSGTTKADEIHEYFIKLEEILHEVVEEESNELRLQLTQKDEQLIQQQSQTHTEKELLIESTLLSQFPLNTQCVYYGKIDNKSLGKPGSKMYQETLIKFGQSNNLSERVKCHKRSFTNFRLVAAFKVKNKIEIENAIKRHPLLKKRIRSLTQLRTFSEAKDAQSVTPCSLITAPEGRVLNVQRCTTIPNPNFKEETYRELLALNDTDFTLEKIHDHFIQIIKENEYNIENYNLLLDKNDQLETRVRELEASVIEKDAKLEKMQKDIETNQSDITVYAQKKIASSYALCKYGYFLYAFECSPGRFKCSISRQKDFEQVETTLKQLDANGKTVYQSKISYPFTEKIMMFLLKQSCTGLGATLFEGSLDTVKQIIDISTKVEEVLMNHGNDLDALQHILNGTVVAEEPLSNEFVDPEAPQIKKKKRSIDQVDMTTGAVLQTYESIEAAGRSLGLTTGTAIGIALREKRTCKGFLWKYTGISKEDQYADQPVLRICCSTGENTRFDTIAAAAKDAAISAPGLRQRILTHVHLNGFHWIFDKSASHG